MSLLQSNYSLTEFFLVGFQNLHSFKIPLFLLLLITYIMAISANLLIVALMSTSHLLRSPILNFCGPNTIDHFYCDLSPILELSCSDTFLAKMGASILTTIIVIFPFLFVIVTYAYIFTTILGITSNIGKQKAFSTCSSHLSVVCVFYGSLISIYFSPSKGNSLNTNKVISLLYTLVTPLFNPVIYTLRNQIIRITVNIFFKRISQFDVHSFC
ncbi:hypothetical protein AB205_0109160 [Aquarana catesbeiana]|uniref:G-protein coupled receptors family 1 profile domain-containing protein n=1 Tax=Aquarana catesbeiana TaxID=8400 RepID=A0A2G9RAG2_AQUCT|nr:hypothetical protein AB205_0109160 [Aquarana catesbeiana]